jgi:CMP-N-acetylneuraminic acid synthetase
MQRVNMMIADGQQEVLAVIPARGGSMGVPKKNICMVAGRPLITYAIDAARQSQRITRIVVSTDCPDIAAVSRASGADIVLRPDAISGDTASSEDAVTHVLRHLQDEQGYYPAIVAFMQCTVPVTTAIHLDKAIDTLEQEKLDSCFSAIPFTKFIWKRDVSGHAVGVNHDHTQQRLLRQQLPEQVLETGGFYIMRTDSYLAAHNRFCGKTGYIILNNVEMIDIDTMQDIHYAEHILTRKR